MDTWGGGGEPSSSDATGTSAVVKTSRPWRLAEEEGPGVTVRCPWHHGAMAATSRHWRSVDEEASDATASVVA
jgi:hypothetical protein